MIQEVFLLIKIITKEESTLNPTGIDSNRHVFQHIMKLTTNLSSEQEDNMQNIRFKIESAIIS